jgi:hypothetical protein
MLPRRDRMLLFASAALVFAWMAVQALTGAETGLLYLAPALALGLFLLGGRYVGEERRRGAAQRVEPACERCSAAAGWSPRRSPSALRRLPGP